MQRPESFAKEKRDCTVQALAVTACLPYEIAHATMKALGRVEGRGIPLRRVLRGLDTIAGRKIERVPIKSCRVSTFARQHPLGRFLCRRTGHAFAVIDGQVIGERNQKRIVTNAWQIFPITITARSRSRK